jgi:TPR repeat protein
MSQVPADASSHKDLLLDNARELLSSGQLRSGVSILQDLAPRDPEAGVLFAVCLRHGIGVDKPQPARGIQILLRLAADDYVPAIVEAALQLRCIYHLTGVRDATIPPDEAHSMRLLDRALELEPLNPAALTARGLACLHGRGCSEDVDAAVQCFEAADVQGFVEAKTWLGRAHMGEEMIPHLRERGLAMLKCAAQSNCSFAHLFLAEHFRLKAGIDDEATPHTPVPSMQKAQSSRKRCKLASLADKHELLAASLGAPQGLLNLAEGCRTGDGSSSMNFDIASSFYIQAFDAGCVPAADALGFHLEKGALGQFPDRIDLKEALAWYTKGYELQHAAATLHLGEAYDDGLGTEVDVNNAESLYIEAKRFATNEGERKVADQADDNLARLYLGAVFTASDLHSEDEWRRKLQHAIGSREAKTRENRVSELLQRLSSDSPLQRRSKSVDQRSTTRDAMMLELAQLVGEGSAVRMAAAYTVT